jgi:hypothetical protein
MLGCELGYLLEKERLPPFEPPIEPRIEPPIEPPIEEIIVDYE